MIPHSHVFNEVSGYCECGLQYNPHLAEYCPYGGRVEGPARFKGDQLRFVTRLSPGDSVQQVRRTPQVSATYPAPETPWLLDRIKTYHAAGQRGDENEQTDVFLSVVNRCAQLSRWAELHTPENQNVPADNDDYWETLANAGHC